MKKLTAIILAMVLVLGLTGCNNSGLSGVYVSQYSNGGFIEFSGKNFTRVTDYGSEEEELKGTYSITENEIEIKIKDVGIEVMPFSKTENTITISNTQYTRLSNKEFKEWKEKQVRCNIPQEAAKSAYNRIEISADYLDENIKEIIVTETDNSSGAMGHGKPNVVVVCHVSGYNDYYGSGFDYYEATATHTNDNGETHIYPGGGGTCTKKDCNG
ncbi:MAG: hypothetical protein FWG33_00930 [Oscillospiraceae bacterium]|nr:hypothetical protein [Oscillospiraceae bacterium]